MSKPVKIPDLLQASAPIIVDGEPTQYQTASARHRTPLAVALACRVAWPEVSWPDVPSVGDIDMDHFGRGCEAWEGMSYGTIDDPGDEQGTLDPASPDDVLVARMLGIATDDPVD